MRRGAALAIALAGSACGRIAFDALGDGGGDDADVGAPDADGPDLIMHFPLDETNGSAIVDIARGMTTTCRSGSCPTSEPAGRVGGAMEFNGGGNCLLIADDVVLHQPSFTLAVWARHDIQRNDSMFAKLIGQVDDENNSFNLQVGDGGAFPLNSAAFGTSAGAANEFVSSPGDAVSPNVWHHVAATFTGGTKRIYVDGVLTGTGTGVVGFDGGAMTIGCDQNANSQQYWDGALDDVRFYRRALTDAEIGELASAP